VLAVQGYSVEKRLSSGSRSEVWLARCDADGAQVALKRYKADQLRDGSSRAQHEYEALGRVRAHGIVNALECVVGDDSPCLVLEFLPGEPLANWAGSEPRPIRDVLQVAIQIASALAGVHAKRWIHRDLSPANIHVDPATLRAHLTDFGSSRMLGSSQRDGVSRSLSRSRGFGGGLSYTSPEQTGRMGRGVDSRSDLYSFGACLYFAVAGRPPFDISDSLALLHAHMARVPAPPHEVDARVPIAVSRIIAKLLEKEPADRYQSASALHDDLNQCVALLDARGSIPDDLALGGADFSMSPVFRRLLFGRERERNLILDELDGVVRGEVPRTLFIQGPPGVGKSALIDSIRPAVSEAGGLLAQGRFEELRADIAHVGLVSALGTLADQILCSGETQVIAWQSRLLDSLGNLAGVVAELIPGMRDIIGDTPPLAPLGPRESTQRLGLALERFLRCFPSHGHLLVICLQDLQWANADSVSMLETLVGSTRDAKICWILSHRSDESDAGERIRQQILRRNPAAGFAEIELGPLDPSAIAAMIADALGTDRGSAEVLAAAAVRKTDASPLLVQEFLLHLHAAGLILPVPGAGWSWNDEEVEAAEIQEGAIALVCAKLDRLPEPARDFLRLLSCIGDFFHADQISPILEQRLQEVEQRLFELSDVGLIVPSSDGFRFAHQRIREVCNQELSLEERTRIHYDIGRQLLSETSLEQLPLHCTEISLHLQLGARLVPETERTSSLAVHMAAGQRTLAEGAPQAARTHFESARKLFRDEDWASEPARAFTLLHESVEAELLCGRMTSARELADRLTARPLEGFDQCRALTKRIRVLAAQDDPHIVREVLSALRPYGIRWSPNPSRLWIWLWVKWLDWCLRGPTDERCFTSLKSKDLSWVFPSLILTEAAPALVSRNSPLIILQVLRTLQSFMRHGAIRSPSAPLAGYVAVRLEVLGHWRGLRHFSDAALYWTKSSDDSMNLIAKVSLYTFSLVWLEPRRELATPLLQVMDALLERGEVRYASTALMGNLSISALVGVPLPELLERIEDRHRWEEWPKVRGFLRCYAAAYEALAENRAQAVDWAERTNELRDDLSEAYLHGRIHWLLALCMFDSFDLADEMLRSCPRPQQIRGSIALPEFYLLRGLAAVHSRDRSPSGASRRDRRRAREARCWLLERSQHAPDCGPLSAFLDAEWLRSRADTGSSLRRYSQAARLAQQAGFIHLEAWIHERAGRFLLRARREVQALSQLRQAKERYRQWGADAKVSQIDALIAELASGPNF